jgi:hypothetical protein
MTERAYPTLAVFGVLLVVSLACSLGRSATPMTDGPTVTLTSPRPGQTAPVGEQILVHTTSEDTDGVQRVELWVDDELIRADTNPDVNSPYIVSQPWQSNIAGTHIILVKAFNTQGTEGQSEPIAITLEAKTQLLPESTPVAGVSSTPSSEESRPTSAASTGTPTPPMPPTQATSLTLTPDVVCTPPPCKTGEVLYCPEVCPGGCGAQCATPTPTTVPPSFEPTGVETHSIFHPIWEQPGVKGYLGYPTEEASDARHYARQYFERGYLYWWDQPNDRGLIWAVDIPQPAANQGFHWAGPYEDTWNDGDKTHSCDEANPNGPVRGFGKLWCDHPEIAEAIGMPAESERGTGNTTNYGVVQFFQGGVMLYSPIDREVWVLFEGGTWQRHGR